MVLSMISHLPSCFDQGELVVLDHINHGSTIAFVQAVGADREHPVLADYVVHLGFVVGERLPVVPLQPEGIAGHS